MTRRFRDFAGWTDRRQNPSARLWSP